MEFMKRALALAEESIGLASPNPAVGCVIVQEGRIVGEAWHEYQDRDHAEVRALAQAAGKTAGASVYLTLEPCSHFGRTPPCAHALTSAGVRRVCVAHVDPNPKVSGNGIQQLRSSGIEVELGLMQAEAARVIEPFACHVTTGLPLVVGKAAMSLDGRIAASGGCQGWITSQEGRDFGQQLRLRLDALLVGVGTILADNPRLTYRGALPRARNLTRIVLDSSLRTPPCACLFESSNSAPVVIFCRKDAPVDRQRELESRGAAVVRVDHVQRGLDLEQVLGDLGRRDLLGVLVEGGSEIHWSFLASRRLDKFFFIVAPIVLGGKGSIPAFGGPGYPGAEAAPRFQITRRFNAGPDLVLEAYPAFSRSILSPWRGPDRT